MSYFKDCIFCCCKNIKKNLYVIHHAKQLNNPKNETQNLFECYILVSFLPDGSKNRDVNHILFSRHLIVYIRTHSLLMWCNEMVLACNPFVYLTESSLT